MKQDRLQKGKIPASCGSTKGYILTCSTSKLKNNEPLIDECSEQKVEEREVGGGPSLPRPRSRYLAVGKSGRGVGGKGGGGGGGGGPGGIEDWVGGGGGGGTETDVVS